MTLDIDDTDPTDLRNSEDFLSYAYWALRHSLWNGRVVTTAEEMDVLRKEVMDRISYLLSSEDEMYAK